MKKILFGIQPTGRIHLGNYLGGIKKAIELQDNNDVEFLIAQYHSLTTQDEENNAINSSIIGYQLMILGAKYINYQTEENTKLAWEIMCKTPVSHLKKMTQWKDKGKGNTGLLTYPCLMAADIILSECEEVIVGEDQTQHFEFYREVCKKMYFKPAKMITTETPRIMSLKDPNKKMSKSLGDEHCIYIGEDNKEKILKANTNDAGITNIKKISEALGIKFDENNCKESKIKLNKAINNIWTNKHSLIS